MPGAITHLKAAYLFVKQVGGIENEGLFYLGSVIPDSVNINGHAPKEIRWPAHLRSSDLNKWFENAKAYYNENKERYDGSYLLGYILHIVTDIVWDMEYDLPLFSVMFENGIPKECLKKQRWAELDGYEKRQQSKQWYSQVMDKINNVTPLDISTLSAENIAVWREKIIERQFEDDARSRFIDDKLMCDFFNSVIVKMQDIIGG